MKASTKIIGMDGYFNDPGGKSLKTINPPVYQGSTVLFEDFADFQSIFKGEYPGIIYGTHRLPTQRAFEDAVCQLEGGYLCRAFQSGISAISNVLMAFTKAGDHILVCDNIYGPTADFCKKILSKFDIETTFIPADVGAEIEDFIQGNTVLILMESPGSNTFEFQDVPAIVKVAKEKGVITMLDNTWATPLFLKPLEMGVDVSIQSVTKYMSGHSDLLSGTVTLNEKYAPVLEKFYDTMELYASADDCAMALRGLKTLPLRLKQHETSALEVAHWLEQHPMIEHALHPALESHPQHSIWERDFSGSSGIFSFVFKEDFKEDQIGRFVDSLELFGLGFSWGGFKSLITVGTYKRSGDLIFNGKFVIRLNIGLEDAKDLIEDLDRGFKKLN